MSEEREENPEEILASQIEAVKNFGPEKILVPEKRAQIVEAVGNGLDTMASTIKERAEVEGISFDEVTPLVLWEFGDFTRSALTTPPLPPQAFEMEVPTTEALVADDHNWWEELFEEQKATLWQILRGEFGIDKGGEQEEIPGYEGYKVIKSKKLITVPAAGDWPENKFYPALIYPPSGQVCLSCYVVG